MEELNLPSYPIKLKVEGGQKYIFDAVRKKYLLYTPEEWVRQNFVQFLIQEKGYPSGLISIERGLKINGEKKRADILIYDSHRQPYLLIECKSTKVTITQEAFNQIATYNSVLKAPYLIVTNGKIHCCAKIDFEKQTFEFLEEVPSYDTT